MSLTDARIWQYSAPPAQWPMAFFTAGVFIDESNKVVTVIDKVGGVGARNPKLPGGITQPSVFQDNAYFQALRAILENCKKDGERLYSPELVDEIILLEKIRDKKNNKYKIAVRNLVLEFLEETGHYVSGEVQFCWYQLQKTRQWHQYFFLVKELSFPKNGKMTKVREYVPIDGFVSVDDDIKSSKAIPFSCALKYFKDADGDQYGEEEGSEKPKNPDCLFPPHQNALKAGGYYRSIEDGKFAYLYESYTFNPCVYW
jgi:hypothetical protein